jgi:hypothetical protein
MNSMHIAYRLLFQAVLEIRDESRGIGNKPIYHLADLFHNVVLQLENAASGSEATVSYDDILAFIKEHARAKGWEKWVDARIDEISERSALAQHG